MKLRRLIEGLGVAGMDPAGGDPEVTGIVHDSRRAAPGVVFVAWEGARFDGTAFAANAATAGAVAVLAPESSPRPQGVPAVVPWLTAADPHRLLAPLADRLHGHPHRELLTAGVTGTNGKSTVSTLLASVFDAAGLPSGLFGSLGYRLGTRLFERGRTTPEASDLFRLLRVMRDEGAEAVAMEVSSHALALGRVAGMGFDLAVFTNLTRDHMDFHADFEDYFQAKKRLFGMLKAEGRTTATGMAAVNADDPYGARLAAELPAAQVLTWGEREGDVRPLSADLHTRGMALRLATPRGELAVDSPLLGRFNLLNVLAAVAGAEALGIAPEAIRRGIADVMPLPGRMQPVEAGQPFPVYVDYSHTPQALEAALQAVRELAARRVLVVFGCGGDRDAGKRPLMGRIAGELAEIPILTSDNPRTEDPNKILDEVEAGVRESGNGSYRVVADRREAIRLAMELADEGSLVLIAGKGDEPVQIVGGEELPFFDYDEAVKALETKYGEA
jgi:UDP-N-acetylmuramoyl-L-alanyl-D-glutamate--2,6-diaminopimelate ligase